MGDSIFWYDLETTGTDTVLDRPLQFAGVRTDLSLREIGEPVNIFCRPARDVLPQPQALLVTGILISEVLAKGLNEKDFSDRVLAEFEVPQTCGTGFNSIRFDDEFIRQMLYRNFRDPYAREWRNGNSRWDVIDLFRAAYALRPKGFVWPEREPGIPSFKLEDLAQANGVEHSNAHDAFADVRATIEITKLLRQAQPKLYEFAWRLRWKKAVLQQLHPLGKQPVVHVSPIYSVAHGCAAVVLPLCQHPVNKNAVICYDLSEPPEQLMAADAKSLSRLVFSARDELLDGEERVALNSVHVNRSPIVAPLSTLGESEANRLDIDLSRCQRHLEFLRREDGVVDKIREAFTYKDLEEIEDPDFRLYSGGFFADGDRRTIDEVAVAEPPTLSEFSGRFLDERLNEMLFRYRARNWQDLLTKSEVRRWEKYCEARWQMDGRAVSIETEMSELMRTEKGDRLAVLQDFQNYLHQL